MNFQWAVGTHRGLVRRGNEDAAYPATSGKSDGPVLIMVADGMGGAVAGEVASRLAVQHASDAEDSDVAGRVRAANEAILAEAEQHPELAGMGTTLTLFAIEPDGVARFAHVGDSRAYLLREEELRQLTIDHTVVNQYIRAGKLTREEAAIHPQRSMLTRALGLTPNVEIDTGEETLTSGDRLLLCSDGVNSMLDDDRIAEAMTVDTAEEVVWALIEGANRAGGHDNITALVLDVAD